MSHFTVLVIGENPEDQLQAYHEFECTGEDDQYVQDIDVTEELRREYEEATTKRLKSPTGALHEPWNDEFYREPLPTENVGMGTGCSNGISFTSRDWGDGKGYRTKVQFIPDGWQEIDVPERELMNFATYCIKEHGKPQITRTGLMFEKRENAGRVSKPYKYGYTVIDEITREVVRVIDRTNPNKKWDWYKLGGRWTGFFKVKKSPEGYYEEHGIGSPGLHTDPAKPGYADSLLKKHIDFDGMRNEDAEKAAEKYDKVMAIVGHTPPNESWDSVVAKSENISEARESYWQQERCKAFRGEGAKDIIWDEPDDFLITREQYIQAASDKAISTFAVIKDGKWYERGQMGWWGLVSNEKNQQEWESQYKALLESIPDDTLLSVYDCHI